MNAARALNAWIREAGSRPVIYMTWAKRRKNGNRTRVRERTYQLMMDGIAITVTKKKIKNVYLRIKRDGTVTVSAPCTMLDGDVRRFVSERMHWIRKHRMRYELQSADEEKKPEMSEKELAVQKADLKHKAELLVAKWEPVMGVTVSGITIRQMKTRWGSCNVKTHHININLALWDKPGECLEYVVIHEMVHILEPSHNKIFWAYVTQYCPNWKQVRRYLNEGK